MVMYYRTCQECFHVQQDVDPDAIAKNRIDAYLNRKCKRCKSIGLDWGSISDPRLYNNNTEQDKG